MQRATASGGVARLCMATEVLGELRSLVNVRNKAAHPEGLPPEEDAIVKALCNLHTKGILEDFAALLDPVKPLVVEPAQST